MGYLTRIPRIAPRPLLFAVLLALGASSGVLLPVHRAVGVGEAITLSVNTGPPLTTPITVNGTGWTPAAAVSITFDAVSVQAATAGPGGTFSVTFSLPASTSGAHTVTATAGAAAVSHPFTVSSAFSLSSTSGSQSSSVQVTGVGFGASSALPLNFNGVQIASATTSANGSFTVSFIVPVVAAGFYPVTAGGAPSVTYQITSSLVVNPSAGPSGTTVSVVGSGFTPGSGISVLFDGVPVQPATTDGNGAFSASFQIPRAPAGAHPITISGAAGSSTTYTISPAITVSPSTVSPGATAAVGGTGFASNEGSIIITFDSTTMTQGIRADGTGSWTSTFTVPAGTSGAHTVRAFGPLTASPSVPPATLNLAGGVTLETASGPPGTSIKVNGSGFPASQTGIILTAGNGQTVTITADGNGIWSAFYVIPQAPSGPLTFRAAAPSGNPAVATFTVTPGISIAQISGTPGAAVAVQGAGFAANATGITVTLGRTSATVNATAQGSWTANLTVPTSPAGAYSVRSGGSAPVVEVPFTITAALTLSKSGGGPGTAVSVAGSGYPANASGLTVTFGQSTLSSGIGANADGSWMANITIPSAPGGSYPVRSTGGQIQGVEAAFAVTPVVNIVGDRIVPGSPLTITGGGFAVGERGISITLGQAIVASAITAGPDGSWSTTLAAPALPAGSYTLQAGGPNSPTSLVQGQTFSIAAGISANPNKGSPGITVTVSGVGFTGGERNISLTFDGAPVASGLTADGTGAFSATFSVPASAGGQHILKASGTATQAAASPENSFQVTPAVSASRATGTPGAPITVTGSGYRANESGISIDFDGTPSLQGIRADAQGSFTVSFTPPPAAAGAHLISVSGSTSIGDARPSLPFAVTAGLSLSAVAGSVGSSIEINGNGFNPSSPITVTYDGGTALTTSSDATGAFRLAVKIPKSAHGEHNIVAQDTRGSSSKSTFTIESTAPAAVTLLAPKSGTGGAKFSGYAPAFGWSTAADPSGVTYSLQVTRTVDFATPVFSKDGIESTSYQLASQDKLGRGDYFWRVRAIDNASNEGPWAPPFKVKSGTMPYWQPVMLVLLLLALAAAAIYYFVLRPKRALLPQPAPLPTTAGGFDPGLTVSLPPAQRQALPAPPRFSLPTGRREPETLSHAELAGLQMALDFLQSIPLLQASSDLAWLEEMIHGAGGQGVYAPEEAMVGRLEIHYRPAWLNHPSYAELQRRLQGQPLLEGLQSYITGVDALALEALALLRDIQEDLAGEFQQPLPPEHRWPLTLSVAQDALSWYRGTFLRTPSVRDYVIRKDPNGFAFVGAESTPFHSLALEGLGEADATGYRDTHLRIRSGYRNSERAQVLAGKLAQMDIQREQLTRAIAQLKRQASN